MDNELYFSRKSYTTIQKKDTCYKRMKTILCISFCANIVLLVVVLVLGILGQRMQSDDLHPTSDTQLESSSTSPGLCVPCSNLEDDFLNVEDTVYGYIINTTSPRLCCLNSENDISNVIMEMMNFTTTRNNTSTNTGYSEQLQWWSGRDFAAHLYGLFESQGDFFRWTKEEPSGTAFMRNLTLRQDGSNMTMESDKGEGMYFVYSLFTFYIPDEDTVPLGYHKLRKTNKADLTSSWTLQLSKFGGSVKDLSNMFTSFVCATDMLVYGDAVEPILKLTPLEESQQNTYRHVHSGLYSNYFGMFKL